MKKNISLSILFHPRWERVENGQSALCLRLTVNSQRKTISLKQKVDVAKWNADKEQLEGNDAITKSINVYITQTRSQIYDIIREMERSNEFMSVEAVKNKWLGIDENEKTLSQVIEYHNTTMHDKLAWGTAKNYYTTQKYVKEFLTKNLKKDDVYLQQLNYKFLTDFEMFLRTHVPGENQKPCSNNTVMKHIERFRKIVSMAVRNDWMKQDPFIKFKPNFIKKDRGYLTEEELAIIENKKIDVERIAVVRDMFVFSCYTGLAYTDAYNLNASNIHLGIDGKKWIIIHRQKTGVQANLPLLPKALQILDKYKDHPRSKGKGTLLPLISNQPFNAFLKEIAVICGINKNLTHHLARHTFATTVCLLNGISMEATSGMLGHTSVKTTQIYGKILPQRISREMDILNKKLSAFEPKTESKNESKTGS